MNDFSRNCKPSIPGVLISSRLTKRNRASAAFVLWSVALSLIAGTAVWGPSFADAAESKAVQKVSVGANFETKQLVAWCIVPFDASRRGPVERAEMVERLGLRRVAYDWRDEHVATFEKEIQEYQKRDIEFFAFWDWHPALEPLIKQYKIHPQIWKIAPSPGSGSDAEKTKIAVEALLPVARKALELGCEFGIYNHGGWSGEPENMIAVCKWLRAELGSNRIGIVYNLHHGHEHQSRFSEALKMMRPYLLCLNLNGMNLTPDPKILPIGSGSEDASLMKIILESGYCGPIGVLDHRPELDSELSLKQNLDGLDSLLESLQK